MTTPYGAASQKHKAMNPSAGGSSDVQTSFRTYGSRDYSIKPAWGFTPMEMVPAKKRGLPFDVNRFYAMLTVERTIGIADILENIRRWFPVED